MTVFLASRLILGLIVVSLFTGTAPAWQKKDKKKGKQDKQAAAAAPAAPSSMVPSNPFGAEKGSEVINASGIVPLGDSRFLLCDNRTSTELIELVLDKDGKMQGPVKHRQLVGAASVTDLEALALATDGDRKVIFAVSSLSMRGGKKGNGSAPSGSLLRITEGSDGAFHAESIAGFREWLLDKVPEAKPYAAKIADEGGMNIEGLAWDASRGAVLVGFRTPTLPTGAFILPIRIKSLSGAWDTSNLEVLPKIALVFEASDAAQGVRGFEFDPKSGKFLVMVGKAISGTQTPYHLYTWDGGVEGRTRLMSGLSFQPGAKIESVASGTIGGRDAIVFADDGGGYAFVWADDARLK